MGRRAGWGLIVREIHSHAYRAAEEWMVPDYLYELRRGEEVIATGRLSREQPLEIGERIVVGSQPGIVRSIAPFLRERELRLVVQLTRD